MTDSYKQKFSQKTNTLLKTIVHNLHNQFSEGKDSRNQFKAKSEFGYLESSFLAPEVSVSSKNVESRKLIFLYDVTTLRFGKV